MAHDVSIVTPNQRLAEIRINFPRKDWGNKTIQTLSPFLPTTRSSPAPLVKAKSLLKIPKEQVKPKYRSSMHPKNNFGHEALTINGLFAHNPEQSGHRGNKYPSCAAAPDCLLQLVGASKEIIDTGTCKYTDVIEAVPDEKGLGSQQSQVNPARFQINRIRKLTATM